VKYNLHVAKRPFFAKKNRTVRKEGFCVVMVIFVQKSKKSCKPLGLHWAHDMYAFPLAGFVLTLYFTTPLRNGTSGLPQFPTATVLLCPTAYLLNCFKDPWPHHCTIVSLLDPMASTPHSLHTPSLNAQRRPHSTT
jgi:hypothetical protein